MQGDLRSQIRIQLQAEGTGEADRLRGELEGLKNKVAEATNQFATGAKTAAEYRAALTPLSALFNFIVRSLNDLEKAANTEKTALESTLVPIGKLIDSGFKLTEALRAAAAKDGAEALQKWEASCAEADAVAKAYVQTFNKLIGLHVLSTAEVAADAQAYQGLNTALGRSSMTADQLVQRMQGLDTATGKVIVSAGNGQQAYGRWNSAGVQLAYGLGDLMQTSGGLDQKIMSVTNNVQYAAMAFGGWAIAGAVVVTAAASIYRNWDALTRLFEDKNPFPQTAGDVRDLERELNTAKETTKKLGEYTSLTADELEKYNAARATTARLEKEIADQKERQKRLEAMDKLHDQGEEGQSKEQSDFLKQRLGAPEDRKAMEKELAESMRQDAKAKAAEMPYKTAQARAKSKYANPEEDPAVIAAKAEFERQTRLSDPNTGAATAAARDTMAQALDPSDPRKQRAAYEQIRRQQQAHPRTFSGRSVATIEDASPERRLQVAREQQGLKDQKEKAEAAEKDKKLAHDLTEQGAENERDAQQEAERQAEKLQKEKERQIDKDAGTYGAKFAPNVRAAALRRAAKGQSPEAIAGSLGPQVERALPGSIDRRGDVAEKIVQEIMSKVQAELAAHGGGPAAAQGLAAEATQKQHAGQAKAATAQQQQRAYQGLVNGYGLDNQTAMQLAPHVAQSIAEGAHPDAAAAYHIKTMQNQAVGRSMQAELGATPQQAHVLAPAVAEGLRQGMDPESALQQAVEMAPYLMQQQHGMDGNPMGGAAPRPSRRAPRRPQRKGGGMRSVPMDDQAAGTQAIDAAQGMNMATNPMNAMQQAMEAAQMMMQQHNNVMMNVHGGMNQMGQMFMGQANTVRRHAAAMHSPYPSQLPVYPGYGGMGGPG